jgi:hypothetical protein
MKDTKFGWVIICENHSVTGRSYIVTSTFRRLRKDAITDFCEGSTKQWNYWRKEYNFRAVKAEQLITLNL